MPVVHSVVAGDLTFRRRADETVMKPPESGVQRPRSLQLREDVYFGLLACQSCCLLKSCHTTQDTLLGPHGNAKGPHLGSGAAMAWP